MLLLQVLLPLPLPLLSLLLRLLPLRSPTLLQVLRLLLLHLQLPLLLLRRPAAAPEAGSPASTSFACAHTLKHGQSRHHQRRGVSGCQH